MYWPCVSFSIPLRILEYVIEGMGKELTTCKSFSRQFRQRGTIAFNHHLLCYAFDATALIVASLSIYLRHPLCNKLAILATWGELPQLPEYSL